jgi:hypothetical protein
MFIKAQTNHHSPVLVVNGKFSVSPFDIFCYTKNNKIALIDRFQFRESALSKSQGAFVGKS